MSGKMKKLICALLTGTMLLSSASMLAFADEPEKADTNAAVTETAEATEAPAEEAEKATEAPAEEAPAENEATEAPAKEETEEAPVAEAPAAENSKYDSDAYYQKALALCQGLGIITGYEDGTVKPDSTVTRAEMSAIILRMLASTSTSTYQNIFSDVSASHWAANTIQTASAFGIVNGFPGGTFEPDGNVLYEQVAKMIVCAMNYHETADYYGGYPNGHLKVAADLGITKNATSNSGVAAERGLVIKMIYNALLADYNEPSGSEYGQQTYKAEKTLAEYAFDVKEGKGVLLGTEVTSITDVEPQKGQVVVKVIDSVKNTSTETMFQTPLKNLEDLIASNITFYYEATSGSDIKVLLAVTENSAKTETVTLSREDVEDIENDFANFDDSDKTSEIKVYGKTRYKIAADPVVVYNGSVVDPKKFEQAQDENSKKKDDPRLYDANKNPIAYNDFLKPSLGTIKLVDNDTDGYYDIVFIEAYETLLVKSASTKLVTGNINNVATSINVNEDENDLTIKTTINGMEAAPRNLKKDNVVSLKRSLDGETLEFTVTGDSFTGSISSISSEDKKVTIAGKDYDVDANVFADCKTGVQAIFYTDVFGRIGFIDGATAGRLQSGEKYGWLMSTYRSDNKEDLMVIIMTQEGKAAEFKLANTVDYWAPSGKAAQRLSKKDAENAIKAAMDDDTFPHVWVNRRDTKTDLGGGERPLWWDKAYSIRLVKYKANSSGELSRLYGAVNVVNNNEKYYSATQYIADGVSMDDKSGGKKLWIKDPYMSAEDIAALKASDALLVDMTNKSGSTLVGGMTGGYLITDDMIEFTVPNKTENYNKAGSYKVKNVVASAYNQRENGVSDDWLVADMDGASPAVLIKFVTDATKPGTAADMDNVGNTSAMVVEKVLRGVDDDDNTVYQIVGQVSGSAMSVTTNTASTLAELKGYNDKKYAVGETLWDAEMDKSLADVLHKGDIIISDGTNILLYACVRDAYNAVKSGNDISKYVSGSNTRNYFWFDTVNDYELDDPSKLTVGSNTVSFDASKAMTTVEIDMAKSAANAVNVNKEVSTVADLLVYNENEGGDYAFVRFADKGALQEIIIYRFLNVDELEQ